VGYSQLLADTFREPTFRGRNHQG